MNSNDSTVADCGAIPELVIVTVFSRADSRHGVRYPGTDLVFWRQHRELEGGGGVGQLYECQDENPSSRSSEKTSPMTG